MRPFPSGELHIRVAEQGGEIVLQQSRPHSLKINETGTAIADHDVLRLKVTMDELARFRCQTVCQFQHGRPVQKRVTGGSVDSKNLPQTMLGKVFLLPTVEALVELFLKMQRVHLFDGYPV